MTNTQAPNRCFFQTVPLLAGLVWLLLPGPTQAQHAPPKKPITPTDSKPLKVVPPNDRVTVRTLNYRFQHDRRLRGARIHTSASGTRVGLNGMVLNLYQRRIASEIAQGYQGVRYVANRLQVVSHPPSVHTLVDRVKAALQANPITRDQGIQVTARRDVVSLRGTVGTLLAKRTAIRLAKLTKVTVVQDHLAVRPGPVGDTLVSNVKAALARDAQLSGFPFNVLARNSYVFLRGTVNTRAQKQRAGDAVAGTPGVTGLSNAVFVRPSYLKKRLGGASAHP